ncbi:hypothetical protein B0H14DRAFT_2616743 [Mycena olivaceomarginata]|nr:hypothetical protein B0H14DRAFT_2616743 [Mycena olivaceomarginata]
MYSHPRRVLFRRLARVQAVQHNYVEPRNVVTSQSTSKSHLSKSNVSKAKAEAGLTLLIDFDHAEMGHACGELGAVAGALGLDIDAAAELAAAAAGVPDQASESDASRRRRLRRGARGDGRVDLGPLDRAVFITSSLEACVWNELGWVRIDGEKISTSEEGYRT